MAGGCILDLKIEPVIVGEMCDLSDKGSECTDNPSKKLCVDCGTSKTPLWRGGPAGPKSLCNACGIRSRKKRRALLEMSKLANDKPEKKIKCVVVDTIDFMNNSSSSSSSNNNNGHSDSSSCKDKLIAMLHVLKQSDVRVEELSEEQQAAVLLMAMSHGFNYD